MTHSRFQELTRPATDEERSRLQNASANPQRRPLFAAVSIVLISAITVGSAVLIASTVFGPERWQLGLYGGIAIAVAVAAFILSSLQRELRRLKVLEEFDAAAGEVAILSCENVRWFSYSTANSKTASTASYRRALILIADLGDGERLCLHSDVLFRPELYGHADSFPQSTPGESGWNGLSEPFAFPCEAFEISYWPHSSILIGITTRGSRIEPVEVLVQSLHAVGWSGQAIHRFQGDPGLTDLHNDQRIELSYARET